MGLTVVTLGCSPRNCGKKSSPILLDPPKYSGSSMNYELCSGPFFGFPSCSQSLTSWPCRGRPNTAMDRIDGKTLNGHVQTGTCLWINPQNAWAGRVPCHAPPQFFRHCFCFWGRPQGNTVRAGLSFPR